MPLLDQSTLRVPREYIQAVPWEHERIVPRGNAFHYHHRHITITVIIILVVFRHHYRCHFCFALPHGWPLGFVPRQDDFLERMVKAGAPVNCVLFSSG